MLIWIILHQHQQILHFSINITYCKQESFLLCFMYVKYKTMLVENTTLYFVESFILWIKKSIAGNTMQRVICRQSMRIYSESTVIRKALSEFRNIENSFLSWLEVFICYLLYYVSLRVWYKALTISRLLWHTHFESLF